MSNKVDIKIVAKEGFVSDESTCYKLSFIHRYTSVEGFDQERRKKAHTNWIVF